MKMGKKKMETLYLNLSIFDLFLSRRDLALQRLYVIRN